MKGPAFRRLHRLESRDGYLYRTTVAPETEGDRELVAIAQAIGDSIAQYDYEPGQTDGLHTFVAIWAPLYKQIEAENALAAAGFEVREGPFANG